MLCICNALIEKQCTQIATGLQPRPILVGDLCHCAIKYFSRFFKARVEIASCQQLYSVIFDESDGLFILNME